MRNYANLLVCVCVCVSCVKIDRRKTRVILYWNGIEHDGTALHIVGDGICVILKLSECILQFVYVY